MSGLVNAFVCSPNYRRGVLFIAFYGLALRPFHITLGDRRDTV